MMSGNSKEHLFAMLGMVHSSSDAQFTIPKETPAGFKMNRQMGNYASKFIAQ